MPFMSFGDVEAVVVDAVKYDYLQVRQRRYAWGGGMKGVACYGVPAAWWGARGRWWTQSSTTTCRSAGTALLRVGTGAGGARGEQGVGKTRRGTRDMRQLATAGPLMSQYAKRQCCCTVRMY